MSSIGINNNLYDNIVSSGEVCREECLSNKKRLSLLGKNYYFIGQELDKGIATNLEIKEVELSASDDNGIEGILQNGQKINC